MTSPSSILVAAADRIRDLAAAASNNGPWKPERFYWKFRSQAMPDSWWWAVEDDAGHAAVMTEQDDTEGDTAEGRARWIAALSPAVAPLIEAWLRLAAVMHEASKRRAETWHRVDLYAYVSGSDRLALDFAKAVCPELVEEDQ